jgi:hypothetical protein
MATPNIETIIRDRVTLTIDCIDRLYLNGYVPRLQTSGQLCWFLQDHLGNPIPSPALLRPLHDRFVRDVATFAEAGKIPVVHFERGQRKDDIAAEHRARFTGAEGVVFIGVAQERASAFKARKLTGSERGVLFEFSRQSVAVNHYYFSVQDREWGPAFVKVGTYLPHPVRVCLNGHEWVGTGRRTAVLRPLGGAVTLAADRCRPDGRLPASAEHLAARSQSDPGLRPAGPGTALLRGGDPREPRPRPARSGQPAVPHPVDSPHAGTSARLPDSGHHHRDRAQPARRV